MNKYILDNKELHFIEKNKLCISSDFYYCNHKGYEHMITWFEPTYNNLIYKDYNNTCYYRLAIGEVKNWFPNNDKCIDLKCTFVTPTIKDYILNEIILTNKFGSKILYNDGYKLIESMIELDPNIKYQLIIHNNKDIREWIKNKYFWE